MQKPKQTTSIHALKKYFVAEQLGKLVIFETEKQKKERKDFIDGFPKKHRKDMKLVYNVAFTSDSFLDCLDFLILETNY